MNIYLKIGSYAALMGAWGVFAFFGKTPVDGFINAIGGALAVLGAVHVIASSAAKAPDAPTPPAA
jgi:hypothetical protein